jgi:hypothetical protein
LIRIYGEKNRFALQIALKIQDEKWYEWKKTIPVKDKNLNQVKEMAYIVLKGTIAEDESEKNILRNLYKMLL